jgi:hypothetical protein
VDLLSPHNRSRRLVNENSKLSVLQAQRMALTPFGWSDPFNRPHSGIADAGDDAPSAVPEESHFQLRECGLAVRQESVQNYQSQSA